MSNCTNASLFLKDRMTEIRGGGGSGVGVERDIFYQLVHSWSDHNIEGWVRSKSGI